MHCGRHQLIRVVEQSNTCPHCKPCKCYRRSTLHRADYNKKNHHSSPSSSSCPPEICPKNEPSNALPISPTIYLPLHAAITGVGLAGNCEAVDEESVEALDDNKDLFTFELGVSPSPSGGSVYCTDPLEGESAGVLGYTPSAVDEENRDPGGVDVD